MKLLRQYCIVVITAITFMSFLTDSANAAADLWQASHAYAVNDYCRTGADPSVSTYKCTKAHTSDSSNKPPNATYWQQVWPKDPAVTSGGEGPTANDWTDFGIVDSAIFWWRDEDDLNHLTTTYYITISTSNSNFTLANNRNTEADKVRHILYKNNYGDTSCPTVTDGNRYWDWYYGDYTPAVSRVSDCSTTKNCVSQAYHNYKSVNTVSTHWTNTTDRGPFTSELEEIFSEGDNGDAYTVTGDRCDNNYHAWWITAAPDCSAATGIQWKDGPSGVYSWAPSSATNDAPKGKLYGGFWGTYCIRNKDSR